MHRLRAVDGSGRQACMVRTFPRGAHHETAAHNLLAGGVLAVALMGVAVAGQFDEKYPSDEATAERQYG
jgi:hypothetical protein